LKDVDVDVVVVVAAVVVVVNMFTTFCPLFGA
jgi:hypothetical protein